MPILPVCDDNGNLLREAAAIVFGRMLFPDRPDMQKHMLFAAIARCGIASKFNFGPNALLQALEMPSQEWIKQEVDSRFPAGIAVGHIYCNILSLANAGIGNRASFNTVAEIVDKQLACQGAASKRTLRESWDLMEPVRHLWAAWVARGGQIIELDYFEDEIGSHRYTANDNLGHMLAEAVQAYDLGKDYRPPSARKSTKTLANPDTAILMPKAWQAPEPMGRFGRFILAEPSEQLIGQVNALKAAESTQTHKLRQK